MVELTKWVEVTEDNSIFKSLWDNKLVCLEGDLEMRLAIDVPSIFIGIDDVMGLVGSFMPTQDAITALEEAIAWIREKTA